MVFISHRGLSTSYNHFYICLFCLFRNLGFVSQLEVGFSASVSRHLTNLQPNQPIIFGTVLTNIGHNYNNSSGVFYVPTDGTYLLNVHVLSEKHNYIETELVVNGHPVAEIYSGGLYYGSGSNLVIAHLSIGDNVWVRFHSGESSNMAVHCCWSTFSGYLLRDGYGTTGQGPLVG